MKTKGKLLGFGLCAVACFLIANCALAGGNVIKSGKKLWQAIDIKVDSKDRVHVLYFDNIDMRLMYAKKVGNKWKKKLVTKPSGLIMGFTCEALSLSKSGKPYVLYAEMGPMGTKQKLYMAKKAGKKWKKKLIKKDYGSYTCDFEMDEKGYQHIVVNDDNNDLKYLKRKGKKIKQNKRIMKGTDYDMFYSSVTLKNNKPYFVTAKMNNNTSKSVLKYVVKKKNKFKKKKITGGKPIYPRLFFDNDGVPFATYYDANYKAMTAWARNSKGAKWTKKKLSTDKSGKAYYGYTDSDNQFHVFYAPDRTGVDERIGFLESFKDAGANLWYDRTWENSSRVVTSTMIVVDRDSQGCGHLAYTIYLGGGKYRLKYKKLCQTAIGNK